MRPVIRCLAGGAVCLALAAALTWFFAADIFSRQAGPVENRVLSFESLRPDLRLEIAP